MDNQSSGGKGSGIQASEIGAEDGVGVEIHRPVDDVEGEEDEGKKMRLYLSMLLGLKVWAEYLDWSLMGDKVWGSGSCGEARASADVAVEAGGVPGGG